MRTAVKGKTRISGCNQPPDPGPGGNSGFSLIELLIVLTLMVGVLTLVPAYFSKGISTAELKSSTRLISAGLRAVRSEAVSRYAERVFLLDVEQRQFFVGKIEVVQHPDNPIVAAINTRFTFILSSVERIVSKLRAVPTPPHAGAFFFRIGVGDRSLYVRTLLTTPVGDDSRRFVSPLVVLRL